MDNIAQQSDEIEALKSIYEDQWEIENEQGSYSIQVTPEIKLFITLNHNYPSECPPTYEILAPELNIEQKNTIQTDFEKIFKENLGGPILFQWIEKLKEIAFTKNKKRKSEIKTNPHKLEVLDILKRNDSLQKFEKIVVHGPTIEDRRSVFQGHACCITYETDVKLFLEYLMENKKIAQATHNIYAYRIKTEKTVFQDCEDDGEHNASKRLLHLLQILNLENVMVVVSRWYGGIQLGPDRFKHITNAARQSLVEAGFIK